MTHRKMIITGLICIALANIALAGVVVWKLPEQINLVEGAIGLISNIISGLIGMYIGKSLEGEQIAGVGEQNP